MQTTSPAAANIVLELPPKPGNARNSEGSFSTLADGRLLFVYTRYGDGAKDDAEAVLAARYSSDGGRTWTFADQIIVQNPGFNVMSVSLLRLADGRLALFYLLKAASNAWRVLWRTSDDEAQTWSESAECSTLPGLYVMNNDRAVQLSTGRLVLPVAYRSPEQGRASAEAQITCLLSDDAGMTWRHSTVGRSVPGVWTQEPLVVERRDGSLLALCRTQVGCHYRCESTDGGESWSPLVPSGITSTLSPASIRRIPATGDLLMIWNNVDQPWTDDWGTLERSPLHAAISSDDGRTWSAPRILDHDPARWFCYTAIHFVSDHVLLAYTAGAGRTYHRMAHLRLVRRPLSWFYDA